MKNYTIAQRQEIYEHLLTLNCPDLLAALIAKRADIKTIALPEEKYRGYWLHSFSWRNSEEGWDFWEVVHGCVYDPEGELLVHLGERTPEEAAVDSDEPSNIPPALLYYTDESLPSPKTFEVVVPSPEEVKPLSFLAKVKLFFGKWYYGV